MINPQVKDALQRYTLAAKAVIYDAERMKQFLQMMGDKDGAVLAVHIVLKALDAKKPIPQNLSILLAINIYIIMVDMAQQATGRKGDPGIMHEVMDMLAKGLASQPQPGEAGPTAQQPQQSTGLIASQMGAIA